MITSKVNSGNSCGIYIAFCSSKIVITTVGVAITTFEGSCQHILSGALVFPSRTAAWPAKREDSALEAGHSDISDITFEN